MFYIFLLLIKQSNICKSLLLFKLNSYQFLFDIFCTNIIATYPIMILTMIVMIRSQYVLQSIWHSHFHISHVFGSTHILLLFLLPPIFQSVSSVSSSVCYNVLPYLRKARLIFHFHFHFGMCVIFPLSLSSTSESDRSCSGLLQHNWRLSAIWKD